MGWSAARADLAEGEMRTMPANDDRRSTEPTGRARRRRSGRTAERPPDRSPYAARFMARLTVFEARTPCFVNLRNVTRMTEIEGGTVLSFAGYEFDYSGPGRNPARLVVAESPEQILDGAPEASFARLTTAGEGAPIFVNVATATDVQAVDGGTRIGFAAFGFDRSGRLVDDHVVVAESPEEIVEQLAGA
jgi:hypothetical protein